MGVVRTIKGEDSKPYISLEDLIREFEDVKKNLPEEDSYDTEKNNFIDIVLKTLHQMEEEYYQKYLFKKP